MISGWNRTPCTSRPLSRLVRVYCGTSYVTRERGRLVACDIRNYTRYEKGVRSYSCLSRRVECFFFFTSYWLSPGLGGLRGLRMSRDRQHTIQVFRYTSPILFCRWFGGVYDWKETGVEVLVLILNLYRRIVAGPNKALMSLTHSPSPPRQEEKNTRVGGGVPRTRIPFPLSPCSISTWVGMTLMSGWANCNCALVVPRLQVLALFMHWGNWVRFFFHVQQYRAIQRLRLQVVSSRLCR